MLCMKIGRRVGWRMVIVVVAFTLVWMVNPASAQPSETARLPDRSPIPLRHFPLLTPLETAGSGVAPEVQVRVKVDARGRVADVKVVTIRPSSEYDDLFRRQTIESILQWRYAPAIEGGKAVATTLKWSVQYKVMDATNALQGEPLDPFSIESPEDRRAKLQTWSDKKRKEVIERYIKASEKHLDPLQRRVFESPRFVVITDAPDRETARVVAGNLEATYVLLNELFQPDIEPLPERYKIVVYLFRNRKAFAKAALELQQPGWGFGAYAAPGVLLFHLEVQTSETLLHTLIHETFHAYSDSHLLRPGLRLPRFLEEGLAEYISNSQIKKGKLLLGKTIKSHYLIRHNRPGALRQMTRAGFSLDELKKALKQRDALSIDDLFRTDLALFYGPKGNLYFPTSWLFVHFLRHGDEEWATTRFPDFLLYLVEGYPPQEALEAVYGATPEQIDLRFREYVKRL